jgi:hypothetical protein
MVGDWKWSGKHGSGRFTVILNGILTFRMDARDFKVPVLSTAW